jgi:thiol-disulfide isomerase/thioredoxin
MTRSIRLVLLASCALALASSFVVRRVQTAYAAQAKDEGKRSVSVTPGDSSALQQGQAGAKKSAKASSAPAVREIDVAGLKKLLAREGSARRPLLVNFWATWCEPCRAEFPDLVKIDDEYRRRGLDIIAVSIDDVSEINTTVPKFLKEMRATMPVYLLNTPEPEAAINYVDPQWGGSLPATFLYDSQGKVVFRHLGRIKPDELRAAIKTVISDK